MDAMQTKTFTVDYNRLVHSLETPCWVCIAFNPSILQTTGAKHPPVMKFEALWDTGATGSVISEKVVQALGLKSTGKGIVYHAAK